MRTRVKICGITSASDAEVAVASGADALGVVLAESPRRVSLEGAERVLANVPPGVSRVGVFVDAPADLVGEAVVRLRLSAVQFSGTETPEACANAPVPLLKAIHVGAGFSWDEVEPYRGRAAAILLDTASGAVRGGTGRTFEWSSVTPLPDGLTVFLAGGLDPGNVGDAVRAVRPFAVDVSSGVEMSPGRKDADKVRAFLAAVRAADERG